MTDTHTYRHTHTIQEAPSPYTDTDPNTHTLGECATCTQTHTHIREYTCIQRYKHTSVNTPHEHTQVRTDPRTSVWRTPHRHVHAHSREHGTHRYPRAHTARTLTWTGETPPPTAAQILGAPWYLPCAASPQVLCSVTLNTLVTPMSAPDAPTPSRGLGGGLRLTWCKPAVLGSPG